MLKKTLAALALTALGLGSAVAADVVDIAIVNRATGQVATTYTHEGRVHVVGTPGERYAVRITNRTPGRVLAVVSVDGVNVVSGETAAPEQSGYVLGPWQSHDIAGWRKSTNEIAAFYFTSLGDSYASRTGRPADVGVIGVAAFRELQRPRPRPYSPPVSRMESERRDARAAADAGEAPAAPASPSGPAASAANEASTASAAGAPPAQEAPAKSSEGVAADRAIAQPRPQSPRERIGTGHGERERSDVVVVDFRRARPQPDEMLSIRYDTYANLLARGVIPGAPRVSEPNPFPGMRFAPDPRS